MQIIDEEGRLLGVLNVIDALVLLVVVAVLLAGLALVLGDGGDTSEPRSASTYVTLDLGPQPHAIAERIAEGDTYVPSDRDGLTITDVYLAPHSDGVRAIVRAKLNGTAVEKPPESPTEAMRYRGHLPQLGRRLKIETTVYNATGTIRDVGGRSELDVETREVLVSDVVDAVDAEAIAPGDTYDVVGRTIGSVESVQIYSTGDPDRRRVFVGLTLQTIAVGDRSQFGEKDLRKGVVVPFHTGVYTLDGRIERLDAVTERGTKTRREVTLQMTNVPPMRANLIEAGMTDRAGGETIAEVLDVRREPSPVVLRSDDGNIYVRDHPLNRDLLLTVNLTVRQTTGGIRFKGETIQQGSDITLAFGDRTVQATVVGL